MVSKSRKSSIPSRARTSKMYYFSIIQLIKNGLGKVGTIGAGSGAGAAAPAKAEKAAEKPKEDKKQPEKKVEKAPEPEPEPDFGAGDLFGDF